MTVDLATVSAADLVAALLASNREGFAYDVGAELLRLDVGKRVPGPDPSYMSSRDDRYVTIDAASPDVLPIRLKHALRRCTLPGLQPEWVMGRLANAWRVQCDVGAMADDAVLREVQKLRDAGFTVDIHLPTLVASHEVTLRSTFCRGPTA